MAPKQRLVFLDLLRGWAVIVMVEVHVFNAFILNTVREQPWFEVLNYINGLVAPSFIFISGFVFMVAAQRKLEEYRTYGATFWRQLSRIGLVWMVGYYLHLPFFSLQRTLHEATEKEWLKFYQADVLHCIALGLLILFLLRLAIRSDRRYAMTIGALWAVFTLGAPVIWETDFARVIHPIFAAYLNGQHYSLFPVFPWLGFMMAGGFCAARFLSVRGSSRETDWFRRLAMVGAAFIVGGALLRQVPLDLLGTSAHIRANPFFVVERLGIVIVLLALCRWWEVRLSTERSFVLDVGKESLLVYAVHLLVIYGQFWNERSLILLVARSWSLVECIAATVALVAVMVGLARVWSWLKRDRPQMARLAFSITAIGTTVGFLIQ